MRTRRDDRVAQRARAGRAATTARVALVEPDRRSRDPRRRPRPLAAQLAAEQHDGAQVLHRHREAELGHEVGPARERFERAAGRRATTAATASGDDDRDGDQVDGVCAHAPQGEAPDARRLVRGTARRGGDLGGEREPRRATVASPAGSRRAWAIDGDGDEGEADRARRRPRRSRSTPRSSRAAAAPPAGRRSHRRARRRRRATRRRWATGRSSTSRRGTGAIIR